MSSAYYPVHTDTRAGHTWMERQRYYAERYYAERQAASRDTSNIRPLIRGWWVGSKEVVTFIIVEARL